MEDQLLQSVIEITEARDTDTLESRLVQTVVQLLPLRGATVIRPVDATRMESVEQTAMAVVTQDAEGGRRIEFSDESGPIDLDSSLQKCLTTLEPVQRPKASKTSSLLLPVVCEGQVACVLDLHCLEDLSTERPRLEGVARILSNFLLILRDSERDKLTGLFNRRTFDAKLNKMLAIQRRRKIADAQNPATRRHFEKDAHAWLAMMDIDFFKRVNDTFGHVYGDEVILALAQRMRNSFRNSDLLFRFGGEEFVMVFEPMTLEMMHRLLNRYRTAVEEHVFPQIGGVTVSMGFARIDLTDFPASIIDRADKALYYSKEHGRNCVHNYESLVEEKLLVVEEVDDSMDLF